MMLTCCSFLIELFKRSHIHLRADRSGRPLLCAEERNKHSKGVPVVLHRPGANAQREGGKSLWQVPKEADHLLRQRKHSHHRGACAFLPDERHPGGDPPAVHAGMESGRESLLAGQDPDRAQELVWRVSSNNSDTLRESCWSRWGSSMIKSWPGWWED